jgi:hypothetical protein
VIGRDPAVALVARLWRLETEPGLDAG